MSQRVCATAMAQTLLALAWRALETWGVAETGWNDVLGPAHYPIKGARIRINKPFRNDAVDERNQRRPKTIDVDERDWDIQHAKLLQGDGFEGLIERAEASRQNRDRIGELEHLALPIMHVAHDHELLQPRMRNLPIMEGSRDDTDDAGARSERRIREEPHQPDPAAAIDKLDPGLA